MRIIKLQRFFEVNAPLGFDSSAAVCEFVVPISPRIVLGGNAGWARTAMGNASITNMCYWAC